MKKIRIPDDEECEKRIAKAEKKAVKYGVDDGLIQRFWEIVSLFPKISDRQLEERVEYFIMNATPGQFFNVQHALIDEAVPMLLEDSRVRKLLSDLSGKKIGLAIWGEYESTITLGGERLSVTRGLADKIPVLYAVSRCDYADVILGRKDPVKMILGRRIRATHKLTLLKWALPHIDILRERDLFDKYFAYQPEIEGIIERALAEMDY